MLLRQGLLRNQRKRKNEMKNGTRSQRSAFKIKKNLDIDIRKTNPKNHND